VKYNEIPRVLQIAACLHNAYRQLGYSSDDIFMEVADTTDPEVRAGELGVFMLLRAQGKEFRYTCGGWPKKTEGRLRDEWTRVCDAINSHELSEPEFRRMYDTRFPEVRLIQLAAALKLKGFTIPAMQN
jgi:hypothetical protein